MRKCCCRASDKLSDLNVVAEEEEHDVIRLEELTLPGGYLSNASERQKVLRVGQRLVTSYPHFLVTKNEPAADAAVAALSAFTREHVTKDAAEIARFARKLREHNKSHKAVMFYQVAASRYREASSGEDATHGIRKCCRGIYQTNAGCGKRKANVLSLRRNQIKRVSPMVVKAIQRLRDMILDLEDVDARTIAVNAAECSLFVALIRISLRDYPGAIESCDDGISLLNEKALAPHKLYLYGRLLHAKASVLREMSRFNEAEGYYRRTLYTYNAAEDFPSAERGSDWVGIADRGLKDAIERRTQRAGARNGLFFRAGFFGGKRKSAAGMGGDVGDDAMARVMRVDERTQESKLDGPDAVKTLKSLNGDHAIVGSPVEDDGERKGGSVEVLVADEVVVIIDENPALQQSPGDDEKAVVDSPTAATEVVGDKPVFDDAPVSATDGVGEETFSDDAPFVATKAVVDKTFSNDAPTVATEGVEDETFSDNVPVTPTASTKEIRDETLSDDAPDATTKGVGDETFLDDTPTGADEADGGETFPNNTPTAAAERIRDDAFSNDVPASPTTATKAVRDQALSDNAPAATTEGIVDKTFSDDTSSGADEGVEDKSFPENAPTSATDVMGEKTLSDDAPTVPTTAAATEGVGEETLLDDAPAADNSDEAAGQSDSA